IIWFIFLMVMMTSIASMSKSTPTVKPNSVLYMNFDKTMYDKAPSDFMSSFNPMTMEVTQAQGLNTVLDCIEKAKTDNNIKGIFIETQGVSDGYAFSEEIRNALADFKEKSGKFIVTYSKSLTQNGYYLASVSDHIILNPEASLTFRGLSAGTMFYKNLFDKLDIEVNVFRPDGNKFKSAVEPYILDKMSDANKEQMSRYITSIWNTILEGISTSRGISINDLNYYADELMIKTADDAKRLNLIDQVGQINDAYAYINELLGEESDKKVEEIKVATYSKVPAAKKESTKDRIAIIYALGSIVDGKGTDTQIGDVTLAKQIKDARLDKNVKAVVFRVNSPGGSALASEIILNEIILTKAEKPVIASYGTYAASGGYYISCMSDHIISDKNTLTGSIGVFGMIPDAHKLLNNKVGITTDFVTTNKYSTQLSPFWPMSAGDAVYYHESVNNVYKTFIGHVAKGRNMTTEAVDEIAQGRVWTGIDALEIGLVDELGGLTRAIEVAAERAGLENYRIVNYPKEKTSYEQIMELMSGDSDPESKIASELGELYPMYKAMRELQHMSGIQARLPYSVEIR
ncbi:signal peptide peptidase SppA, partial [Bacteroidales bacterium OttesenSCG-928-L14]|nr:signal peptide peptidase SppA [Bacteroidales bacterium OttesenSCG-928-L14]